MSVACQELLLAAVHRVQDARNLLAAAAAAVECEKICHTHRSSSSRSKVEAVRAFIQEAAAAAAVIITQWRR